MTETELRERFGRVKKNTRMVKLLDEKAEAVEAAAMGGAVRYDRDKIQTTPGNYQERCMVEAAGLRMEAARLYDECGADRLKLLGLINTLESLKEQITLIEYYFNDKTIREIAAFDSVEKSQVWRRREAGIKKILKNLQK